MKNILILSLMLIFSINANAITVSTGDLGNNVVNNGEAFSVFFDLTSPSNSADAFIDIKYGLWQSPDVPVDTSINGMLVGSFIADQGYSGAPEFINFDVTGLLLNGTNEISFLGSGLGGYVIGQVDVTYSAVPIPAALWLFGSGLIGLLAMRRKSAKTSGYLP